MFEIRSNSTASSVAQAHLGEMKLSPRSSGADDYMLGEEKALPLPLLLQRQRAQSPTGDLDLLAHRHLDERPCMWEKKSVCKWKEAGGREREKDTYASGKEAMTRNGRKWFKKKLVVLLPLHLNTCRVTCH